MEKYYLFLLESPLETSVFGLFGLIIYLFIQQFNSKLQMQELLALKEEVAQNIVTVEKVDELIIANNKVALDLLSKIEASDEAQTAQINKITAVLNGVVPEEEVEVVEEEVTPAVDEPVITEPVAETEQTA